MDSYRTARGQQDRQRFANARAYDAEHPRRSAGGSSVSDFRCLILAEGDQVVQPAAEADDEPELDEEGAAVAAHGDNPRPEADAESALD